MAQPTAFDAERSRTKWSARKPQQRRCAAVQRRKQLSRSLSRCKCVGAEKTLKRFRVASALAHQTISGSCLHALMQS